MANVVINDTNLTNIADAIREKNGLTDTYKPSEMAAAILAISSSGGGSSLEIPTKVTTEGYLNYHGAWDWLFEQLDELIIQVRVQGGHFSHAFFYSNLEDLSKFIVISDSSSYNASFAHCSYLKELPQFRITKAGNVSSLNQMFYGTTRLRNIPNDFFTHKNKDDGSKASDDSIFTTSGVDLERTFCECYSLREAPALKGITRILTMSYMFDSCACLNEIVELPVNVGTRWTSNKFTETFEHCFRMARLTFETNANGTAKTVPWTNQTIDLSRSLGVANSLYTTRITGYNSGITEDKRVVSGDDYARLKDDPDWWTTNASFSRYNHESAVETINSLPDTSAFITSNGGTNTIKFSGDNGELSGGYIKNLTAAEIAVATNKGWTVTLV